MKTLSPTISLLIITTLAVIVESPIVLGIAIFGFCIHSVLDQVLLSTIGGSLHLKDLQIERLQYQLEANKSNE
jgi:hypothetical protein